MPENRRMTTRLKELFERPWIFVLAGGMNGKGAEMAEAAGYGAFYMSEGNTSARSCVGRKRRQHEEHGGQGQAHREHGGRPPVLQDGYRLRRRHDGLRHRKGIYPGRHSGGTS